MSEKAYVSRIWPGSLSTTFICLTVLVLLTGMGGIPIRAEAAPVAQEGQDLITSPQDNTQVAGTVQIIGSATHPEFQRYELAWAAEPVTDEAWVVFATIETPIENGVLATWNTAQAPDGLYSLRLRVVRLDGNYGQAFVRGVKVANSQPVASPTSPVGPTIPPEEPTSELELATATPELIIQPPTSTPQPPTPTPASDSAASDSAPIRPSLTSFSINLGVLGQTFCKGAFYTFGLFFLWGLVLSVRGLARWILRRVMRRRSREIER